MQITFRTQPAPELPEDIVGALDSMSPRVFLRWNPRYRETGFSTQRWNARWQIWCELNETTQEDAAPNRAESDEWNSEAKCWVRRLQTYSNADGSFAPIDERLLIGLEMADTWVNRRFYEDHVEDPYNYQEQEDERARGQIYADGAQHYMAYDTLSVGQHFNSGWRWRHR